MDLTLQNKALHTLVDILNKNQGWERVHAAEVLIANGKTSLVEEVFQDDWHSISTSSYRVGGWRVLASIASEKKTRDLATGEITEIFLTPSAPDKKQAIESLAKLKQHLAGASLDHAKGMANGPLTQENILPLWALHFSHDPSAIPRLRNGLTSKDPIVRQRSAYALRWIRADDPLTKKVLSSAASRESPDTLSHTFLISAAYTLQADPNRLATWKKALENALQTRPPGEQLEAALALAPHSDMEDIHDVIPMLDSPHDDTRVAAALLILATLKRSSPAFHND